MTQSSKASPRAAQTIDHPSCDASVVVKAVETAAERETFIRLPWALYGDDPAWVPPLLQERRDFLNPRKNPIFETADVRLWLAFRDGRPVGRISAQVNRAHLARYQDATGHFGLLEGEDRAETFAALLTTAECWLREQGMRRAVGPFSLSINEESGLLVEGFAHPPALMMGHAQPYYATRLEAAGYAKVKDLICYRYGAEQDLPAGVVRFLEKATAVEGLTIRSLDMGRYEDDLASIMGIFNDAWSENWGFLPMSAAELRAMARDLKPIVRPQTIAIAELASRPVAMAIGLPNVNEAIADLDGRLLPFGWAKLLWRLKVRTTASARVPLMGVLREFHGSMLGAALAFAVIDAIRRTQKQMGVEWVELSWILEDNLPMRRMLEQLGADAYKTYRVYARDLGG
ncbi:dATP pyrophosphohydrolase [Pelagibius sp.]|uniref:dATP pyrophosphohydrolase n=1 Tax=Pelagibius sp. TaxID=1931238 RepID=UPI00261EB0A9|nr:dATP pyrophosphohydrolase [Pelagibius sp.]